MDYLAPVIGFMLAVFGLNLVFDIRQLEALKLPKPPAQLDRFVDKEAFDKTRSYSLDKWWFGLWHGIYSIIESLLFLCLGGLPLLWRVSGSVVDQTGLSTKNELVYTIVFVLLISGLSMIMEIPWNLYGTFVLEEKHGFNKQTVGLFFSDLVKQVLLGCVLIPPIVGGITFILIKSGIWMPVILWLFVLFLSIIMMTVYPTLIAPLFNKYEALPEGSLRSGIEKLASSIHFPLKRLYSVDGSKRSAHSNAYMYGFFKNKRIVLYDTLIQQCKESEVIAVLAHELGHWKLSHTIFLFATAQFVTMLQFGLFAFIRSERDLYKSFGFVDTQPAFIAMVLFQFISSPLDEVIGFLSNIISRAFEYQADGFAVSLGFSEDLKGALIKLQLENKSALNVDRWYSTYHYSHPPLVERLKAIDARERKTS